MDSKDNLDNGYGQDGNFLFKNLWIVLVLAILALIIWLLIINGPMRFERDDYFIPNQIVLAVTAQDERTAINIFDSALENIPGAGIVDGSVIAVNISQANGTFCAGLPANLTDQSFYVVALAEFNSESTTVEEVIESLDSAGVTAEPNLVTGSPDYPTGSTVTWPFAEADPGHYAEQWAFRNIDRLTPNPESDGSGVRVVVFDTVPTALEAPNLENEDLTGQTIFRPGMLTVDWVDPDDPMPMDLKVGYAFEFAPPDAATAVDMGLSHHGLFAAQMVHAIAPASNIELIRVLDSSTHGNLYTLILAFYDNLLHDQEEQPTVVNMSLGIRIPPPKANFRLPTLSIEAFQTLVQLAYCRDIVIVAASGNNSIERFPPELAHLPADWSSVIAVAASNSGNQRSCFSNQGEIAAPGGDGRSLDDRPLVCQPKLTDCVDGNCPYAIVGPIMQSSDFSSGLIFWEGSSFASPMVAGLAARVLAESPTTLSPDDVRHIIECGATEATFPEGIDGHPDRHIGEGVINVERTLSACLPAAPDG